MNKLTMLGLFTYVLCAIMSFAMCKWECGIAWTCASLMTVLSMLEERGKDKE